MNLLIWLLLTLFLPLLLFFLFYKVVSISFVKLGIPGALVFFLFVLILVGSLVNIPVWYSHNEEPGFFFRQGHYFFFHPPQIQTVVVAMNVGGAIIPLLLSLYLLPKAPLLRTALALAVVALVANLLAKVEPGVGVTLPPFVTPLLSAGVALVLAWRRAAPVAYISGTLGTLIGADLLNLGKVIDTGATYLSIGGAGVFDGIFLTGIIAAFLSPGERR
jgi:uncharacterized membrane protein